MRYNENKLTEDFFLINSVSALVAEKVKFSYGRQSILYGWVK